MVDPVVSLHPHLLFPRLVSLFLPYSNTIPILSPFPIPPYYTLLLVYSTAYAISFYHTFLDSHIFIHKIRSTGFLCMYVCGCKDPPSLNLSSWSIQYIHYIRKERSKVLGVWVVKQVCEWREKSYILSTLPPSSPMTSMVVIHPLLVKRSKEEPSSTFDQCKSSLRYYF